MSVQANFQKQMHSLKENRNLPMMPQEPQTKGVHDLDAAMAPPMALQDQQEKEEQDQWNDKRRPRKQGPL
jgi:hypothetical protein